MSTFDLQDINVIEGEAESELDYCLSLQRAINGGMWSLQGSYGRAMMEAIEAGQCMLGQRSAVDYWRHRIPSRTEVKKGTKGSRAFVAHTKGEAWARKMAEA
jgi:hypothetical protein